MSRYDLLRRRIAPIAFGLAIALMARETCDKQERTHATFVFDLGSAERDVDAIDAELWMGGEPVVTFHRAFAGMPGIAKFTASLPAHDGELRVDVDVNGVHKHTTRRIHADEGATVTIALDHDLR